MVTAILILAAAFPGAPDESALPSNGDSLAILIDRGPLGVGRAHFDVPDPRTGEPGGERFNLAGDQARLLYPVYLPDPAPSGPAGRAAPPAGFEVLFLFRGGEPGTLIVSSSLSRNPLREFRKDFIPERSTDAPAHRALLDRWWRGYRAVLMAAVERQESYPAIESYLLWHLPRRLGLEGESGQAEARAGASESAVAPEVEKLVDLFLGTESIRIALQRDRLLERKKGDLAPPSLPFQDPPALRGVEIPEAPPDLAVEPIARAVPPECLYLWFPRFSEFQRLLARAQAWGGNLTDLIAGRSLDSGARQAIETQLALRETAIARLFGDVAIGETAILAADTFVREGSALGVLFQVKNEAIFSRAIADLRKGAIEESRVATEGPAVERTEMIRGAAVSLLESPGHRVRSFHAALGRYHIVANCRRLVERFLEVAAEGKGSLAEDPGFRHARVLHPLIEPLSALVFISDPFLRQLIGPGYRAEMTRRMRSAGAMELVEIARRVRQAETGERRGLQTLVREGYLPESALESPEGSRLEEGPGGELRDTLRGGRGSFLPIPDMDVRLLTPSEAQSYQSFSFFYQRQWERLDPAVIAVRLSSVQGPTGESGKQEKSPAAGEALERIDLVVDLLPFAREPYQVIRAALGAAVTRSLAPPTDELFGLEVHAGALLSPKGFLFRAGILDFQAPYVPRRDGAGRHRSIFSQPGAIPAYLMLPVAEDARPETLVPFFTTAREADGFVKVEASFLERPLWGKEANGWIAISQERETAERLAKGIALRENEAPAQARLEFGRWGNRRISPALRAEARERTWAASRSSSIFLSTLHGTLKVPLESCEAEAIKILGARLGCPAGGHFRGNPYPAAGGDYFSSDAFPPAPKEPESPWNPPHEDFRHPLLDWLEDLKISLTLKGRTLHSEATLFLRGEGTAAPGGK